MKRSSSGIRLSMPSTRTKKESTAGKGTPLVCVHISARRKNQQWSAGNFAALIEAVAKRYSARILLLWAPGEPDNARHPGDDDKARAVIEKCRGLPLLPCPTEELPR